ncbi:zinc finger protein ZAT9-like [Mangifera indica]|uniref:zinc finger protein ZAT9-like n=1 Tax=Mangifera indica TaxID=29780 RepID=UPI001CF9980D|nr:zinc finger protein ZAT9-like [Mangifera indica]
MEPNQKKKFICKFCHKRYPCGKSLGGHIRTHMNNNGGNTAAAEEGVAKLDIDEILYGRSTKKEPMLEAGGQSGGYVLRENPKRTKRFADSNTLTLQQEMVCKECGKGFQSLKALCGHMACHSEKFKTTFEDQKLIMDSESDTETSAPSRLRRSKRVGYKSIDVYNTCSFDIANGNSSVSGIEQEQEEIAMCLMMLSRDPSYKKGLNSFADSSDNNSVVLEAKSSSTDMKISGKNGVNCVSNCNEFEEMKKGRDGKSKSAEIDVSDNSDSGYFRNGPKKFESDASVDGFIRNGEFKKSKEEYESCFEDFGVKLGKKYDSRKKAKTDSSSPETFSNIAQKRSQFECLICNKVFHSHRSLWGHTASHSKINGCCESINESGEHTLETDSFPNNSKVSKSFNGKNPIEQSESRSVEKRMVSRKSKGHECPFCFRVFKSGQALGGHKRSHFVGGSEDRTVVIKQQLNDMHGLIDLNLPAPMEEEATGEAGFAPW